MNWFTNKSMAKVTEEIHSKCKHLKEGDIAHRVSYENDGLGEPESYAMCKVCSDESLLEQNDVEERCRDCGELHKTGDMIKWRPYDFYAPQGDEPLLICNECCGKEKHRCRVEKDRGDFEDEINHYNKNRH